MQIKAKESSNVTDCAVDCENALFQLLEFSVLSVFHFSFYFRIQCCATKREALRDDKSVARQINIHLAQ